MKIIFYSVFLLEFFFSVQGLAFSGRIHHPSISPGHYTMISIGVDHYKKTYTFLFFLKRQQIEGEFCHVPEIDSFIIELEIKSISVQLFFAALTL